jgi:VanZ family protein
LAVYWPFLFFLTHAPVQDIGRQTGMSDKTMHWLAYMGLVFLVWLAVSPYEKVNWRRAKVWLILVVVVWYGAIDEWLQMYVGRRANVDDFLADMAGTMIGLGLLSVLSFWPAALAVTGIFVFIVSNRSYLENMWNMPYIDIAFHFAGYSAFTLVWIQYLDRMLDKSASVIKWTVLSVCAPLVLLAGVKICSIFYGKEVLLWDCLTAVTAICLSAVVSRFVCRTMWVEEGGW